MGLFGGDSKSATTTLINQADNKSNNDVEDNGVNLNFAGANGAIFNETGGRIIKTNTNKHGTTILNTQDFNHIFGSNAIAQTLDAMKESYTQQLDFADGVIDRFISVQSDELSNNHALLSGSIDAQEGLIDKVSDTPDDRLGSLTKIVIVGALGIAGFSLYKGK